MTADPTTLRLLTLNALFRGDVRARLRALGGILDRAGYDVVCLQEVMYRHHARLLWRLARSYPHHASTGAVALGGGLVILSRWPIVRCRFGRYPVSRPLRPELLMRKGAQLARVAVPGGDLAVVNTHLSANRDHDWSAGNRYSRVAADELDRLGALMSGIDPALPVVVAGDFNLPRDSPVLARFRAAARLRDALAGSAEPTYRPTPELPAPPAFDHVLVRPAPDRELTARSRIVFRDAVMLADGRPGYLSDHYGVDTELVLPAIRGNG
ncbi:endonuclease/exonuclease/phosphatase family protein [Rugosimonospora acidiphila]|uniref:endonuclease/exonuclease/phosphatase family protein n=1 Tax=Rugosimonospora acidiphila TaxID=556531 RepID=UPI0031E4EAAC